MISSRIAAALVAAAAASSFAIIPGTAAWAATAPLCTSKANVVGPAGNDLLMPVDSGHSDPTSCTIAEGEVGGTAAVVVLQQTMVKCYGLSLAEDGSFGPKTKAALETVQKRIGADVDGSYGPMTRSRMRFQSNDVPNTCVAY